MYSKTKSRSRSQWLCILPLLALLPVAEAAAPAAATLAATQITATSAQLNGMVTAGNLPTTCWFEWAAVGGGVTNATAPQAAGSGSSVVYVTNAISGLTAGDQYECRLVASNSLGVVQGAAQRWGVGLTTAWGDNGSGQTTVPAGLGNVVAIAGGYFHSLALRADGSVAAWGDNNYGQTTVPAGLSNVVAIAGGVYHSLALRAAAPAVAPVVTGQLLNGGNMRLSFVGSSGIPYALDRSYNLSPPVNWVPQMTNFAGVNGVLVFTNLANPTTNNFWRIRSVP